MDITRFGPFVPIKVNGYTRVIVADGIAKDGVIQAVGNVLIPPRKPGFGGKAEHIDGEMSVEEFKSRFEGVVEEDEEMNWDL